MTRTDTQTRLTFIFLVSGTVLGLAGIDLVLPAIPFLPTMMEGSIESAQLVLASFAAGTAIGLLIFGELGARFNKRALLISALLLYALSSFLAAQSQDISQLVVIRFIQGLASSAPAVFAPGLIRSLFDQRGAIKAIGLMGSIESLTPALAPVVGAWLLTIADWRASFLITASLALFLSFAFLFLGEIPSLSNNDKRSNPPINPDSGYGYFSLFRNREFMRQSLSHACTLGGLLIFVFGAPTVITTSMGGDLVTFIIMQLIGISLFIVSANLSDRFVARYGSETMVVTGSGLSAFGGVAIMLFAVFGNADPRWLWLLFAPINLGLGLRGPPGFYQAVVAAGNNESRGAALLILFILGTAAIGTALIAPFISNGLLPLSSLVALVSFASVMILFVLKKPRVKPEIRYGER